MMGLDVYVLGALAGCAVYWLAFRLAPVLAAVWWPESGDGGDETPEAVSRG